MKTILILTALLLSGFATSAMAGDFSGSFGRDTSCQPSNGNWENDAHKTCPMQGGGFGAPEARASTVPVETEPCPPKETETPA